MTKRRRDFFPSPAARCAKAVAVAVLLLAGVGGAESARAGDGADDAANKTEEGEGAERGTPGRADSDTSDAAEVTADIIRFVPPSRGKARHSAAGGTRDARAVSRVRVAVVAPAEGLTTRAQPVLYWYLSRATDARIDVVLTDDEAIDPLLELTLPTPVDAGIHALDLAEHGVSLATGRTYRWSVAVVQDEQRRSNDIMTEGVIERTGASERLVRTLENAPRRFAPYALSGIWYDALAELRRARRAEPTDPGLQRQEVALLEQIELHEVARYARTAAR